MGTFAEGIESIRLACSLVLLIPALGIVLFGRRRRVLVPTWIATMTLVAWLRFVGWWELEPSGFLHVLAGIVLLGLAIAAWQRDDTATDVATTALAATIAAWTWVPCVGRHLGEILNAARAEPWRQLPPTVAFMVGLSIPLVVLAALDVAAPQLGERLDHRFVRIGGLAIVAVVGGLVSVTLFDDLAGELARRSSF
ncbi:MAG: hypothetical protein AAF567_01125 [Actinomycetota bacterium]